MATNLKTKRDWESQFHRWSQPPGSTEQQRCENAVNSVRNAIRKSQKLSVRNTIVFPQGSYRNRVNVRHDSDVDVGILCTDTFFDDYPEGKTRESYGNSAAVYNWAQFKNEVGEALTDHFGAASVTRGNKAFDVRENSYHVEADVVPLFEYRQYWENGTYRAGVALRTDKELRQIQNYPEILLNSWPQTPLHYENGVHKNTNTSRRYKKIVRIIKSLRNEMNDNGVDAASPIPGFLIESALWNTPDTIFSQQSLFETVRSALAYIYSETQEDEKCAKWTEVNNIKYLFHSSQAWTRIQLNAFVLSAFTYIEAQ